MTRRWFSSEIHLDGCVSILSCKTGRVEFNPGVLKPLSSNRSRNVQRTMRQKRRMAMLRTLACDVRRYLPQWAAPSPKLIRSLRTNHMQDSKTLSTNHNGAAYPANNYRKDLIGLVVWIGIVFLVSAIGSLATRSGLQEWYGSLNKPSFQPPSWIFGPVWTCLYIMMAVAAWMVWRHRGEESRKRAVYLFTVAFTFQLALNALWSIIFFGYRSPAWAAFEICLLWCAIAVTTFLAYRQNKWSGHLLIPYLAWASFALVLNIEIWRMN